MKTHRRFDNLKPYRVKYIKKLKLFPGLKVDEELIGFF